MIRFAAVILAFLMLGGNTNAQLGDRAPDYSQGAAAYMYEPGWWIARMDDPDRVILDPASIRERNRKYDLWIRSGQLESVPPENKPNLRTYWPGTIIYLDNLTKLEPSAVADTVRKKIGDEITNLRKVTYGNAWHIKYSPAALDEFEREMDFENIPVNITPQKALAVRTSKLRHIPDPSPGFVLNASGKPWERFNAGILKIAAPVQVLHRSRTGQYAFILCESGYGWVNIEDIAFAGDRKIRTFTEPKRFVVCTADRVPFYNSKDCKWASGFFRMGDRLPLASSSEREIIIPSRDRKGNLVLSKAWLAPDADVNIGWLPYTPKNIIETSFKLLGTPYDWTGSEFGRQHDNFYRDLFACFGFELPVHAGLFPFYGNDMETVPPVPDKDQMKKVVLKKEPFVTIVTVGSHAQLYLGEYEGKPIVLDINGYGYEEEGKYLELSRCYIGDMRYPDYFLRNRLAFLQLK